MGKVRAVIIAAALFALLAAPATGAFTSRATDDWTPSAGGFESGALEYAKTEPTAVGGAMDATLHEGYLYLAHWRSFSIYDVRDPLNPRHMSTTPLGPFMFNERPQTNGDILLLSGDATKGALDIYDVRDKEDPSLLSSTTFPARTHHIWTCVEDCRYAYGSHGRILDLSDPSAPEQIGDWRDGVSGGTGGHGIREYHTIHTVAPDRVVVGADPVIILDVTNPTEPRELARFKPRSTPSARPYLIVGGYSPSLPARVDWPQDGDDRFMLVSMETPFSGTCSENSGDFLVYDTAQWDDPEEPRPIELAGSFAVRRHGTFTDGHSPYGFWGCTAYGMKAAPTFADDGLVATAFMENGVRLLQVDDDGEVEQVGGFLPHGGTSVGFVWVTDDVIYAIDLYRGLDILRVDRG